MGKIGGNTSKVVTLGLLGNLCVLHADRDGALLQDVEGIAEVSLCDDCSASLKRDRLEGVCSLDDLLFSQAAENWDLLFCFLFFLFFVLKTDKKKMKLKKWQ